VLASSFSSRAAVATPHYNRVRNRFSITQNLLGFLQGASGAAALKLRGNSMFAAFKERRPWAAALITFVFDPFIGMLYLNRGQFALLYLAAELAIPLIVVAIWSAAALGVIFLAFRIVGAIHAHFVARNRMPEERNRWYAHWYALVAIFLLVPAAPLAIRTFLYQSFHASSGSMTPTMGIGDNVFASKFAYRGFPPRRGDVVVFRPPHHSDQIWVKRILGIPGDRVQFLNGVVLINGQRAQLRPLFVNREICDQEGCQRVARYLETLPGSSPHMIQRLDFASPYADTLVYAVPANNYFVVGDNRDNSIDSRMDELGFVPANAIVGRVTTKYFDGTKRRWTWETVN
jgi:signal peptidase I